MAVFPSFSMPSYAGGGEAREEEMHAQVQIFLRNPAAIPSELGPP